MATGAMKNQSEKDACIVSLQTLASWIFDLGLDEIAT